MSNLVSEIMNSPVSGIMSTKLVTVIPTDGLDRVKKIFEEYNIHHLPVVRSTDLQGMISRSDFDKAIKGYRLLNGHNAEDNIKVLTEFNAEDLMTKHVVKIAPEDKIGVACEIFLENYFHAIPVVNEDGELKGIVTSYDITKRFFQEAYPNQEIKKIVE